MIGRALTPETKRAIVERILRAWLARPALRLGQMIVDASDRYAPLTDLFHLEDEALAEAVEYLSPPAPHDLTPSEIALARMLDAWEKWPGDRLDETAAAHALRDHGETFKVSGLAEWNGVECVLTASGRDLLDRARKAGAL